MRRFLARWPRSPHGHRDPWSGFGRSLDDLAHHLALALDVEDRNAIPPADRAANDAQVDCDGGASRVHSEDDFDVVHGTLVVRSRRP